MDGLNENLPVKSVSIENMVNVRAGVMDRLTRAIGLIAEARDMAQAAHIGFPSVFLSRGYRRGDVSLSDSIGDFIEAMREDVDRGAWSYLMDESGMRTFMDTKARSDWDKQLGVSYEGRHEQRAPLPEFTAGNVQATFGALYAQRGEFFDRGVIAVFKSLSWDYKTHLPQKFGKRFILTHVRGAGYFHPNKSDQLDDMTRVMCVLDGKPEPDHRYGWHALFGASLTSDADPSNDYMSVRLFLNGNGHVTFKRPDLVDQLNRIIAKHYPNALPAPK